MTAERVAGACLVLAAVAIAADATTFEVAFLTDPVGPKALPCLVALILAAAGARMAARPGAPPAWPGPAALARIAGAVGVFFVYGLVLPWLGFILSTTAAVTALSLLFGGPPLRSTVAAAALSSGIWLLFVRALALPLPLGSLWIVVPR
jgi:putative tricarboxylic transport membrane protein